VAAIKVSGAILLSGCRGHFFWPRTGPGRPAPAALISADKHPQHSFHFGEIFHNCPPLESRVFLIYSAASLA